MLNLQRLRDRLGPTFRPFRLSLSDGPSFVVPHCDFIAVGRGLISVIDQKDIQHTIDPLRVVSIDDTIARAGANGN